MLYGPSPMMTCGFQTGGPPLGPTSQCSTLPSQQRVPWGAYMRPVRATVAPRPCSWRRRVPVYASQTDGQVRGHLIIPLGLNLMVTIGVTSRPRITGFVSDWSGYACFTQAWEDKTMRERQAREAREVLTPLQVQQMWLEVMGRSLSNTQSTLVAVSICRMLK